MGGGSGGSLLDISPVSFNFLEHHIFVLCCFHVLQICLTAGKSLISVVLGMRKCSRVVV